VNKRCTEAQWKDRLGDFSIRWSSEWFIDLDEKKDENPVDELNELINSVFSENGLNSISYKEASRVVAETWLKQNQSK
jgi:hypothetical protein